MALRTEPIIFQGGSWDGEYTDIMLLNPPRGTAERKCRTGPGHDVYVRSQDTVEFQKRANKKKVSYSTVYKFAGTKEVA